MLKLVCEKVTNFTARIRWDGDKNDCFFFPLEAVGDFGTLQRLISRMNRRAKAIQRKELGEYADRLLGK